MDKRKLNLVTSDQLTKDLLGKKGKKKRGIKKNLKNVDTANVAADPNVIILPETRMSDDPPIKKVSPLL